MTGSLFIEGNMTGDTYLDLLRNEEQVVSALQNFYTNEVDPALLREIVWLQQDGTTPHYAVHLRVYLNKTFSYRWIGPNGALEWSAGSPDITSLDFIL